MKREMDGVGANIHGLIREIKNGDEEAFMTVVRAYQQKVFVTAYSILRNREDALDIVQETFLRLHQKADLFKEGGNFQGWLLQITKNLCVDAYRKTVRNGKRFESSITLNDLQSRPDAGSSPPSTAEMKDIFSRYVDRLSGRQRMVFVLKHVNELRYREISETMNISVGTVKSLHFKAVQNLRKWLDPQREMSS